MNDKAISHSDDIAMLIWGAYRHPDAKVRTSLRNTHDEWLESCQPLYSRDQVRNTFLKARGTFLEPYSFPGEVMEEAISLAQAAFSKAYDAQRIYVANVAKDEPTRGLVLTAGLSFKCVERYALGNFRKAPKTAWSLKPLLLPTANGRVPGLQKSARLYCDDEGFDVRFCWPGDSELPYGFSSDLASHSRITGIDRNFNNLGVSLYEGKSKHRFSLRTTSPESMIRFMGLLEEERELFIDAEDSSGYSMCVQLHPVPEGRSSTKLPTRVYTKSAGLPWIRVMPSTMEGNAPKITTADKVALAKLFPCPLQWRDEIKPILDAS